MEAAHIIMYVALRMASMSFAGVLARLSLMMGTMVLMSLTFLGLIATERGAVPLCSHVEVWTRPWRLPMQMLTS